MGLGLIGVHCGGADTTAKDDGVKQFGGKVLIIHTKDVESGVFFSDPEIKTLHDRSFLVGKMLAPNKKWKMYEGKTVWVAMDVITQIYELANMEELKAVMDEF